MKIYSVLLVGLFFLCCDSNKNLPVADDWVGLSTKQNILVEQEIKAAGHGKGVVHWWAGGYTYANGFFVIELVDSKTQERLLYKNFYYGDADTGQDEKPKFHWWHSETKGVVTLQGGRVYKMILRTDGLAEPGAGWGMWLYDIGKETGHPKAPLD